MERCPICRARFKQSPCYRCGSPLEQLLELERKAECLLHQGVKDMAAGDVAAAQSAFQQAAAMHQTPLAAALLAFVSQEQCKDEPHPSE